MRGDGGARRVGDGPAERLRRLWAATGPTVDAARSAGSTGSTGSAGWVPGPPDPVPVLDSAPSVEGAGSWESAVGRAMAGSRAAAGGPAGTTRRVPVRAVLGALLLVVALFAGGGARILVQRPQEVPATVPARAAVPASPAAGGTLGPVPSGLPVSPGVPAVTAAELVVHVVGRVRRPGVRRLPTGSRVADAVAAAGGTTPGAVLARLNLARRLVDGEQVVVPGPGDPVHAAGPAAADTGTGSPGGPAAPVDLNAATQPELDALPGVGPVLAGRILAWRTEHGRFTRVDELGEVAGIGPKALERLRPLVTV